MLPKCLYVMANNIKIRKKVVETLVSFHPDVTRSILAELGPKLDDLLLEHKSLFK